MSCASQAEQLKERRHEVVAAFCEYTPAPVAIIFTAVGRIAATVQLAAMVLAVLEVGLRYERDRAEARPEA